MTAPDRRLAGADPRITEAGRTGLGLSVRPATMPAMTATIDGLAPFHWLNLPESDGGGPPLGVIFSVAYFRGLDAAEVARRFSHGTDPGTVTDFGGLVERVRRFVEETAGCHGGGHVGIVEAGEWCVAVEPHGWLAILSDVVAALSRGCEMLSINRHDHASVSDFVYAIDGEIVTTFPVGRSCDRHGADPDLLNDLMRELGMCVDPLEDAEAAAQHAALPQAFALAARITGVPFAADMLDRPMLVARIADL